ncbi:MAG: SAM-dependent methyltransferase, partial [Muribaculaceae bacterium]|nr:SAM-dependent methyltransferase [Muribaculaceae bacterium]
MKQPVIEHTADGSPTLYLSDLNEHYHSVKGALTESMHVYVDTGWRAAAALNNRLKVFEVGFGTGLNAALTADAALAGKVYTEYHSVELHPLPADLTAMMGYDKLAPFYDAVNRAPWNTRVRINDFFFLTKSAGNFLTMELPENIAVVYFDAFAPEKQPEMWSPEVFNRLYEA